MRFRTVVVSILVVTVATQPLFLLASGAPQIGRELGFGPSALGVYTAIFFLTASVVSSAAGRRVEVIGWPAALRASAVGGSIVLLLIATLAGGPVRLAMALLVGAAVYGLANPAANLALARMFPPGRQGVLFGIKHAGIPASILIAGLAVPALMLAHGWRWAYVVMAVVAVGVVALVPRTGADAITNSGIDHVTPGVGLSVLRMQAVAAGFAVTAASALGTFAASAAVDEGISEAGAGYLVFAGGLMSIVARVAVGVWTDRHRSDGYRPMSVLMAIGVATVLVLASSGGAVFGIALVLGYATAWGWPGLMTFSVVNKNTGRPAAASAVVQAGIFVGAGIAPLVFGFLAERVSFRAAWLVVAAGLAAAVGLIEAVRRRVAVVA